VRVVAEAREGGTREGDVGMGVNPSRALDTEVYFVI